MESDQGGWLLVPESVRRLPADLVVVIILSLLVAVIVSLPNVQETPFQIVFALPFVLFLPGYAFVAVLFPENDKRNDDNRETTNRNQRIDPIKRIALPFGMSSVIVPLSGFLLNSNSWDINLVPAILSVSAFVTGCAFIAAIRRKKLPAEERFSVPYREWIGIVRAEIVESDNRTDTVLSVVLALSIIFALGSVGFAVAFPHQGEQFTEFYLLTADEDGELVAADYPTEFVQGESQSMIVGIENNEHETVNYVVVVQLEQVEREGKESRVIRREELDRFETTLAHDEMRKINHEVTPTVTGENLRLTYLLYKDEPSKEPTVENSYHNLHLWITVVETDVQEPIEIPTEEANAQESNQVDE